MPANTQPIFTVTGDVSSNAGTTLSATLTAAANDTNGTSSNNALVFTAGPNGSFIQRIRFKPSGTNVSTMARIFINNGVGANTTASNNAFYGEIALSATTISTTASMVELDYPMNFVLPAGFKIYVGLTVAVAAGWTVIPIAGMY